MANPLGSLIPESVAGAVAGAGDKPKRPSIAIAFAKSVAKSTAMAPINYAKDLGNTLTQAALQSIPGYYLVKSASDRVLAQYRSVKEQAEALERQIQERAKDQQKAADDAKREEEKNAQKAQREEEKAAKKKERDDRKAFQKAWADALKEHKERFPGEKPPRKPKEPPIARPDKPKIPKGPSKIAVLEQKLADTQVDIFNLSVIIKNLTTQTTAIAKENAKLGAELAKMMETAGDTRKREQIAQLQQKENVFETSYGQNDFFRSLEAANANMAFANDNKLEDIIKGVVTGQVVRLGARLLAGLGTLVGGLVTEFLAPVLGIIAGVGAAVALLDPDDKTGISKIEDWYNDFYKEFDPKGYIESHYDEIAELKSEIAALEKEYENPRMGPRATGITRQQMQKQIKDKIELKKKQLAHSESEIASTRASVDVATGGGIVHDGAIELSEEDKEALIRLMHYEAGTQSEEGKAAVAYSVLNRLMISKKDGVKHFRQTQNTVQGIINATGQYDAVTEYSQRAQGVRVAPGDRSFQGNWRDMPPLSSELRAHYMAIIDKMTSGQLPDPTEGATFYLNRGSPGVKDFDNQDAYMKKIGDHTFYGANAMSADFGGTTVADMYEVKSLKTPVAQPIVTRHMLETATTVPTASAASSPVLIFPPAPAAAPAAQKASSTKGPEDTGSITSPYNRDSTFVRETMANASN